MEQAAVVRRKAMMHINERRLRQMFSDQGFCVREIRAGRHWVARVERNDGGLQFNVVVARTPSDRRFEHQFNKSLKRAEREALLR
jgi:hypothetical protein